MIDKYKIKHKIVHLKINRGADLVRSAFQRSFDLGNPASLNEKDILDWWKNVSKDFKNKVFKPRSKIFDIEVTAFLLAKLDDITIYSSNYNAGTKRFRSTYIISNENVVEMKALKVRGDMDYQLTDTEKHIVKPTKPVLVTWMDAISNHTLGTAEVIMKKSIITPIKFAGFLIGTANDSLYTATAYSKEVNKYRGVLVVPLMNVVSVKSLK